jgi:membrane carboxypeptidase/penicillin-binding protein
LRAQADLALGRERLLAGDADAARAAFARAGHWRTLRPEQPAPVPGEPLVLAALDTGRLEAAASAARDMRQANDPLGPLYAAVAALESGDEAGAREAAAASRVPLASRGLGARLARALAARDAGARTLLLDRNGELTAAVDASGAVRVADGVASLLPGVLERLHPVGSVPAARLAVDLELSRAALTALGETRGSIVLVDARTGALRAAVSDARTAATDGAAAFTQRREPASIAKILTAAAAYRAGVDVDAAIAGMTCTGVERYGGRPLWCAFPGGRLAGLDDALGQSCNVAFANVGTRLGASRMLDEYRRWGFGDGPSARLGSSGRIHTPPRTPRQLAFLSVGLELVDVTPLHAALLAAVVANEGRMPEPQLLIGACGPLGLTGVEDEAPASREVLAPAVARRLRQAMEAVARSGTGVGLAPPGFAVAMKTGTAAERGQGYHVNYIGIGPLPGAELAFCVRVTHQPTSAAVTTVARSVTRALLGALADRWQASRRVRP